MKISKQQRMQEALRKSSESLQPGKIGKLSNEYLEAFLEPPPAASSPLPAIEKPADTLDNLSPVTILHQSQNVTSDKLTPVTESHQRQIDTSEDLTPVTTSPVTESHQRQIDTSDKMSPVLNLVLPEPLSNGFIKLPNLVIDNLMRVLDPSEFTVYLRLYRLSHGFQQTTCLVGYTALSEACNLSPRQVKRIIPDLISKGLIKIVEVYNESTKKGTVYEINTLDNLSPVSKSHQSQNGTSDKMASNKDSDHDFKKKDHHQSPHMRETMTIYQDLTGNPWAKTDDAAYDKIKDIPADQISTIIRQVLQRAPQKPATLAYFVKEILSPTPANPSSRAAKRAQMEKVIKDVKYENRHRNGYLISELSADVKEACAKEGISFDLDLFNEITSKT